MLGVIYRISTRSRYTFLHFFLFCTGGNRWKCLVQLYTSGSTGKPKGVEHTLAGYMIGASTTFKYVFDHRPDDIYWCTADCGWITGHSYVAYGQLYTPITSRDWYCSPIVTPRGQHTCSLWGVLTCAGADAVRQLHRSSARGITF